MRLHGASYYICDDPNDSAPLDGNIPMKISFFFFEKAYFVLLQSEKQWNMIGK
jgi:hypothetical protein